GALKERPAFTYTCPVWLPVFSQRTLMPAFGLMAVCDADTLSPPLGAVGSNESRSQSARRPRETRTASVGRSVYSANAEPLERVPLPAASRSPTTPSDAR